LANGIYAKNSIAAVVAAAALMLPISHNSSRPYLSTATSYSGTEAVSADVIFVSIASPAMCM